MSDVDPLEELLEDDEVLDSNVSNSSNSSFNPFLDEDGDSVNSAPVREVGDSSDDGELLDEDEVFDWGGVTRDDLPGDVELPDDVRSQFEEFKDLKESGKNSSGSGGREFKGSRLVDGELESNKPVEEVFVPGVVRDEVSVSGDDSTPGEKWSGRKSGSRRRYRWVRDNGMLNGAELEFFKNLGASKRSVAHGDFDVDPLRAPVGVSESEVERKERIEKITRVVGGRDAYRRNRKFTFGVKDKEMLEFLAMFRYATSHTMSSMFSEAQSTSYSRLKKLRGQGLVIDKKLIGSEPVWFLTDAGMLLSGYDLPKLTEARMTYSMFPHQFTVNHVAANLWGGNINVLNEKEYPVFNRVDDKGREVAGDELVSEFLVQSSFGKLKLLEKADVYLPVIKGKIERAFRQWRDAGGVEFGPSPEQVFGNEYMWVLFPPMSVRLSYHVPDLVVSRPRSADGSPNSVAIEVELANKSEESYRKTLQAYRYSDDIYSEVVWVVRRPGAARKLKRVAEETNLLKEGRLRIVPIITEDGVFKGKDLWTL